MNQEFQDKLLELLRIKFNLYHANCIISLLTDDSVDVKTFVEEIKKMILESPKKALKSIKKEEMLDFRSSF